MTNDMTAEPETTRTLGYLEGRIAEQSVMLQDLKAGQQEANRRLDAGLAEVNLRIDRLFLAIIGIGGGIIAALVGLVITLIVRGV
jgi:hypothetical protein